MTYEEIKREVREICSDWLTEAQIDATAQVIWAVRPDGLEQIGMFGAGTVISWMIAGKVIPVRIGLELGLLEKRVYEEDD